MIEVHELTKRFGHYTAVAGLTFEARKGEILGFLGPNGAGKTTTMRMLTCYLPPTDGRATVAGFDILADPIEVRRRIGYLPENVPLYGDLSVTSYLEFVGKLKGMSRIERLERIPQVMAECGIDEVSGRTIAKLSKGYRQRVGLAQALLNDPEVLILDEPTVGLDPQQIIEIRDLIRNLSGRRTIILSTHILPEVSLLCQRVIIINKGRLVTVDTPQNLKARLSHAMVIDVDVRGDSPTVQAHLESLPDVQSVVPVEVLSDGVSRFRVESSDNTDVREQLARSVVKSGFGLVGLKTVDVSLEDIFVHLVTREEVD